VKQPHLRYHLRTDYGLCAHPEAERTEPMNPFESQARRADSATIAAIMNDACDEPLRNKATRMALYVLTQVPGLAEQRSNIMMTSLAHYADKSYVACSNHEHTVLFMGKHAFALSRDDGGVPWVDSERMYVPDMTYFKGRVRIDDGLSDQLLEYVEVLMENERRAVEVALEYVGGDECSPVPAP
jgi:hypothetical protein